MINPFEVDVYLKYEFLRTTQTAYYQIDSIGYVLHDALSLIPSLGRYRKTGRYKKQYGFKWVIGKFRTLTATMVIGDTRLWGILDFLERLK